MSVVKKQRPILLITTFFALSFYADTLYAWASNARNDPFPMYTSLDPQYFLYQREKQLMFGFADEKGTPETIMISLCPFGQNATEAKTISATYCKIPDFILNGCEGQCNQVICANANQNTVPTGCSFCINSIPLGDIDGRWNLLGLLAGNFPQGFVLASVPLLATAFGTLFAGVPPGTVTCNQIDIKENDPCDPRFGFVSVPLKYRKRGIRWDIEAQICGDFGLQFQGGIVEISQVLNPCFTNLTTNTTVTACAGNMFNGQAVNCALFDQLVPLARQLGMDICNFTKWGFEDMFLSLYWRHAHVINYNRDLSWARLLLIPFFRIGGGIATGRAKDPSVIFSLPFGNNGSNSVNFNVGMNLDFVETVEVGAEVGYSHFFSKDFTNFRVPTNSMQSGIFPFATNVSVKPGDSAYVAGKLAAYHFLDRLSFYFQWVYVHHRRDCIRLLDNDPAFLAIDDQNPQAKCPNTVWRVQLGNIAFTYDVSPNIALGFLWQQMFHVRNAFNSTTALFTFNLIF
jgi:hypothetical protein